MITTKTASFFQMALTQLISEARDAYNSQNISNFNFTCSVSGRTTGDLKVSFCFNENSYGYNDAKSHNPISALQEILRRHGWAKENTALVLTYSGDEKVAQAEKEVHGEEIPF